ncbi:MAG: ABC transporter ATP-binding protein [Egibacteraceae bacterium]
MHTPVTFPLVAGGLVKRYGRGSSQVTAVADASLRVRAGEIVGIHGSSGSGKSTLLRLLAGVERPTAGTVRLQVGTAVPWVWSGEAPSAHPSAIFARVAGRSVHRGQRPHPAPGVVMPILQDPVGSLDPRWPIWRSITEPLTAPHRPRRPARSERREFAARQLATVGLQGIDLDALPGELSRGQCQRVAILRALAAEPAVVLADEPTSALDVSVSAGILHLLAGIAERGAALVVVSHDLPMLDALCHRLLPMHAGHLGRGEGDTA